MSTAVFALLRHAATVWNQEKRIQGHWDSELSPEGAADAARWAETLAGMGFSRLFVSDLARARATAGILNLRLKLPMTLEKNLREQKFGEWTGRRVDDLRGHGLEEQVARGWEFRPPGGESRLEVFGRAERTLCEAARLWPGKKILAVTHEGVVKALVYRLLGREFLPDEKKILKPATLHWVRVSDGRLELGDINVPL
ncbi:histidine phosphatase family protein [Desulfolutivibrio sulfoxidireducens]|uniref:histidine phosphatase family protein n=1 Tax=Desulfolutivibrio sulfoxidireducens TaxID=2773299 RepID=UPI00159DD8A3|nr:histidine phosphatase family protein [Desulfolutivibrio sulfoxidireducens]QLA17154.1 histidine phosphatase family protein [Desulfolutivibrio sulfoxidireducens]QLA20724.1 histidine phosphatase family protein [Desulfolutivibrio sulfoxidireducens]